MKEAKLSYLADVMSDYAKWLSETSSDQHIADNIAEWASTIREVLTMTDGHFVIEKTLDIRRLETKIKVSTQSFYFGKPNYDDYPIESAKQEAEYNLLHYIRKNKLIEVKMEDDGHGIPIASASLYVGIRPNIHLQQSPYEP